MNQTYCYMGFYKKKNEMFLLTWFAEDGEELLMLFTTKGIMEAFLREQGLVGEFIPKRITWKNAYGIAQSEGINIIIDGVTRVATVIQIEPTKFPLTRR